MLDIARYKSDNPTAVIQNLMRNKDTVEFLSIHNPNSNPLEFERVRKQVGLNVFPFADKMDKRSQKDYKG